MAGMDAERSPKVVRNMCSKTSGDRESVAQVSEDQFEAMKHAGDAAAVIVTVGTVASILPPVAAFLTIIWTAIRIWETDTCRRIVSYIKGE